MENVKLISFVADALEMPASRVNVSTESETAIKDLVSGYVLTPKSDFLVREDIVGELVAEDVYDTIQQTVEEACVHKDEGDAKDGYIHIKMWSDDGAYISKEDLDNILSWYPKWYTQVWALQQFAGYSATQVGKMDFKTLKRCFEEELEIPTFLQDRYC